MKSTLRQTAGFGVELVIRLATLYVLMVDGRLLIVIDRLWMTWGTT